MEAVLDAPIAVLGGVVDTLNIIDTDLDLEIVDRLYPVLAKLNHDQLQDAARTFEINGVEGGVSFLSCFVACLYGEPGALMHRSHDEFVMGYPEIVRERVPQLASDEIRELSSTHFTRPHVIFAIVSDLLDE